MLSLQHEGKKRTCESCLLQQPLGTYADMDGGEAPGGLPLPDPLPTSSCVLLGIRQLQLILLKVALILGIEIHVNVEFQGLVQPPEDQENERESDRGRHEGTEWVRTDEIMGGARRTCRWFSALTKGALFMQPGLLRTFGLPKRPLAQS